MKNNVASIAIKRCSELLYQLKEESEYFDASKVLREACDLGYRTELCIANDFFTVTRNALEYSMMVVLAKLCSKDDRSVVSLYDYCKRNKGSFGLSSCNLGELSNVLGDFEKFQYMYTEVLCNIRTRRNKYYAHNDKKYFENRQDLVTDAPLSFDDIESVFNHLNNFCMRIYFLLTQNKWQPILHQKCLEHSRNCNDLYKLLTLVDMRQRDNGYG